MGPTAKGAAAIALAVAAAMPVMGLSKRSAAAATLDDVNQALVLLANNAEATDPEMLAKGISQLEKGQFEDAQVTLQQVKVEGLPAADKGKLTDALAKVEAALNERKMARAEFEMGEKSLEEKNY